MQIAKDTVVTLNLQVFDPEGNIIDDGSNPLVYLHGGYDGIFPRMEEELHGKNQGDAFELKLEPDDAFGEYDEELVRIESLSLFPDNIEVGMQFERGGEDEDDEDGMLYTITDIADGKVVVDGNHPLSGISLHFKIAVTEVRPATTEEITHGHVHGAGGHHH